MKIKLLGSSAECSPENQYLTTMVINDSVAIDAGSLGFCGNLEEQARVRHIVFSHTHIDHVASLPIFLENVYEPVPETITLHGSEEFHACLSEHIFNNKIWPDFLTLGGADAPFCQASKLEAETPIELEGLRITPVEVNHGIPAFGFLVEDGTTAVAIASDTAATERLWELARKRPGLAGIFLDCSFPNDYQWLADASFHMTPNDFAAETKKLKPSTPCYAVHIKARYRSQVIDELESAGIDGLVIAIPGKEYTL